VASSGVASDYLVTLEVTGRKSGRTISLPVVIAIVDGQRYLLSMLGDNAMGPKRVQNVRAAGGRAVLRSGGPDAIFRRYDIVDVSRKRAAMDKVGAFAARQVR